MPASSKPAEKALAQFADSVAKKFSAKAKGAPEDQLRGPMERLLEEIGKDLGFEVVAKGESKLPGRLGRPDYAVLVNDLLAGYLELKPPGTGARPERFKGHDKEQWGRFRSIPNLLYSDGNEWGLYQADGPGLVLKVKGDVSVDGHGALSPAFGADLSNLLKRFFLWEPIVPSTAKQLAETLAPLCRLLRDDVVEALRDPASSFVRLAKDWREILFPNASDFQFADAYAQTVTYALLLARSMGATVLDLSKSVASLKARHTLLARALQILTQEELEAEVSISLRLIQRVLERINAKAFATRRPEDPWLYFYEDFLGVYDPELRRNAGVYYTPVQVVHAQVRLVDELLRTQLNRPLGFAENDVVTLDPAVGTGTYLLGVMDHALSRVRTIEGPGAVPGRASLLARHVNGFEIMVGPYAVAELRLSQSIRRHAPLPSGAPNIFLADTLESSTSTPKAPPLFYEPLAKQHERARHVKESVPVLVLLGNPPYDRHPADPKSRKRIGGWVRWGDKGETPIFESFLTPARTAGLGVHLKNLYNLYVYFWRWALWKVFEHKTATGPGIVSFISASSYLDGPGFIGMREHLRRLCDDVWIIDLGGEGRGARKSENVFAIQTPVAIAIAARFGKADPETPAKVFYTRIEGSREDKLAKLGTLSSLGSLIWSECPTGWHDPFHPTENGHYSKWPLLTDLFPWQHSGAQFKRTWPIGPSTEVLERRWKELLTQPSGARAALFRETRDRRVSQSYPSLRDRSVRLPSIYGLKPGAVSEPIVRYAYRSLDRQWTIADGRLGDFIRESLWRTYSEQQVFLVSFLTGVLGHGPAAVACSEIPDLDHFRGSYGGKHVIPLWRNSEATEPNILPGLLDLLKSTFKCGVSPEDMFAYCYSILSYPGYAERFSRELEARAIRVPITRDKALFQSVADAGRRLLWLHTYGHRFVPAGGKAGEIPSGSVKCASAISDRPEDFPDSYSYEASTKTLAVGSGRFVSVEPAIWDFEVSGLSIVRSWLDYRIKPRYRPSSALDDIQQDHWPPAFTTELLHLLWVLEATLAEYPAQKKLFEKVLSGPLLSCADVPPVPDSCRKAPETRSDQQGSLL